RSRNADVHRRACGAHVAATSARINAAAAISRGASALPISRRPRAAPLERRYVAAQTCPRAGIPMLPNEVFNFLGRRVSRHGAKQNLSRFRAVETLAGSPELLNQRLELFPREEVFFGPHDARVLRAHDVLAD